MDSATEDLYLQKLQELVYDEEKTITSLSLSCNLDIDIKESKLLLGKYVEDVKDAHSKDILVTYVLSGITKDGRLQITIVKDSELDQKKSTFDKVVDQQIYSIQRCKELDLNVLSMVDHFDMHNPKSKPVPGCITSKKCIERIFKMKKLITPPSKSTIQSKPSLPAKVESPKTQTTQSKASLPTKIGSPKTDNSNSIKESAVKVKQSNGITSFFNKGTPQSKVKPVADEIKVKSETSDSIPDKKLIQNSINKLIDGDSESDTEQPIVKSVNTPKHNGNQKSKPSAKRSKKKNEKEPSAKRRKRIVEQESDSDDMFGSDTKEDLNEAMVNLSDEEVSTPKPRPPLAPKNKKRKLVDRTYTDDDGYIITTKEWIEENPSEEEIIAETPQKELKKVESKTEIKPSNVDKKLKKTESSDLSDTNNKDNKPMNGKAAKGNKKGKKTLAPNQPTLMNFFKRA